MNKLIIIGKFIVLYSKKYVTNKSGSYKLNVN